MTSSKKPEPSDQPIFLDDPSFRLPYIPAIIQTAECGDRFNELFLERSESASAEEGGNSEQKRQKRTWESSEGPVYQTGKLNLTRFPLTVSRPVSEGPFDTEYWDSVVRAQASQKQNEDSSED